MTAVSFNKINDLIETGMWLKELRILEFQEAVGQCKVINNKKALGEFYAMIEYAEDEISRLATEII